jgi:hypothetical protein
MRLIHEKRSGEALRDLSEREAKAFVMNARRWSAAAFSCTCFVLIANDALAYCPTMESARKGFALVGPESRTRVEVKSSNDDIVSFDLLVGGKLESTPTYYKGIFLIRVVTDSVTTTASYDFDYTKEPDLHVGYHKTFHITLTAPDGTATTRTVDNRVVGRESVVVGDCTLDTLVLEGQTAFTDRPMQTRRVYFSPALRTFVRTTITNDGSPPTWILYDHIEPPAR